MSDETDDAFAALLASDADHAVEAEAAPKRRGRRPRSETEESPSPIIIVEEPAEVIIPISEQTLAEMEAGRKILQRYKGVR